MAIPPMAGGAGRRRALAKAIYALNYYQLGIIKKLHKLLQRTSPLINSHANSGFGLWTWAAAQEAASSLTSPGTCEKF